MKTLTFKATEDEVRLIRALARREGSSLSEYLRRRATGMAGAPAVPERVCCPFTGAMIFAGVPGAPPLTTESVGELLADFP